MWSSNGNIHPGSPYGLYIPAHCIMRNESHGTHLHNIKKDKSISVLCTLRWRHNWRWRLKSPALRLFTQPFFVAQIKEYTKAPSHWLLCKAFTGEFPAQMVSKAENLPFDDVIMNVPEPKTMPQQPADLLISRDYMYNLNRFLLFKSKLQWVNQIINIYIYIYARFLRILEFRGQKQHDKVENLMKDNTLNLVIMYQITFDKITFLHILGPNHQSHGMNCCRNSVPNFLRCLRPNLWLELYLQACSDSVFFSYFRCVKLVKSDISFVNLWLFFDNLLLFCHSVGATYLLFS